MQTRIGEPFSRERAHTRLAIDLALHPTVKPTALVLDALQDVTRRGTLVLDIFLGWGTPLIAAERCGRGCLLPDPNASA